MFDSLGTWVYRMSRVRSTSRTCEKMILQWPGRCSKTLGVSTTHEVLATSAQPRLERFGQTPGIFRKDLVLKINNLLKGS